MKFTFRSAVIAASLVMFSQPSAEGAQGGGQQNTRQGSQRQDQDQGQGQGRRGGGPGGPGENERQLRAGISQRMKEVLQLPDSTLARLTATTFTYRDSALMLMERDQFIRMELGFEQQAGRGDRERAVNPQRISCLMENYWLVQGMRLDLRQREDRQIATLLTPIKRLQYFGIQEALHEMIDDALRRGREGGGRGGRDDGRPPRQGGGGGGGGGGRGVGPPPGGPPPGGGRLGGPGGPGGRGALMALCPRPGGRG